LAISTTDALEDDFVYHDIYKSIKPCKVVRGPRSQASKADEQGDTAKDSSFSTAAIASSLKDLLDVTINSIHLPTTTIITSKEY